jgi:hypothetical protein
MMALTEPQVRTLTHRKDAARVSVAVQLLF